MPLFDSTAVSHPISYVTSLLYKRCRWMVSFHKLRQRWVHSCFSVQLLEASTLSLAMSPAVYPRYKELSFLLFCKLPLLFTFFLVGYASLYLISAILRLNPLQVNTILSAIKRKKSMDTIILSLVAAVCTFLILIYWLTK